MSEMSEWQKSEFTRLEGEVEKWKTLALQAERSLVKSEVTWRFREAARKAGVVESALDDVTDTAIRAGWKLDTLGKFALIDDKGGVVYASTGDRYLSPADWIEAKRDERNGCPHWWGGVQSGGTAGANGTAANPYLKGQENWTEQGRLESSNPTLAKQLAEAAGVKLKLPA